MQSLTPEQIAYLKLLGIGAGIVLLADVVLFWVLVTGWMRERSLLARRWSAAHVLIAFQAWLLPTIVFTVLGAAVAAAVLPRHGDATEAALTRWVTLAGLAIQNVNMAGVVLFTVLVIYDQYWVATGLSLRKWAPRVGLGLIAAVLVVPISQGLEWLSIRALQHLPFAIQVQRAYTKQWQELSGLFEGTAGLTLAIVLVGLVAPFAEELFFRGFVYRCFRARWGVTAGIIASAALFALIHVHPVGLVPIFFIGCVLAYLYERTGTLVAPITLHAVNNIVAVLAAHFAHGR